MPDTKDTNPKDAVGIRKWRQFCTIPLTVMAEVGVAMLEGARKYGRHNYRVAGVRASVYVDAAMGHIAQWWEGEDTDPDSKLSHITKAIASLVVLRDAMIQDMLTDDRPPKAQLDQVRGNLQNVVDSLFDRHPQPVPAFIAEAVAKKLHSGGVVKAGDFVEASIPVFPNGSFGQPEFVSVRPHDWNAKPGEDLCIDEGCDHHGTPHICISTPAPVEGYDLGDEEVENLFIDGEDYTAAPDTPEIREAIIVQVTAEAPDDSPDIPVNESPMTKVVSRMRKSTGKGGVSLAAGPDDGPVKYDSSLYVDFVAGIESGLWLSMSADDRVDFKAASQKASGVHGLPVNLKDNGGRKMHLAFTCSTLSRMPRWNNDRAATVEASWTKYLKYRLEVAQGAKA